MAKKKKGFTKESFESGKSTSNFIALYWDMWDSKAWQELNAHERNLYLTMRRKYQRKVLNGMLDSSNKNDISMPKKEYEQIMHQDTFYKCIDNLIEKGFVKVVRNGRFTKQCNIYGFVDMWQKYGTQEFEIHHSWRRKPIKK